MRKQNLIFHLAVCAILPMVGLHSQTYFSKKFQSPDGLTMQGMNVSILPDGYMMTSNYQCSGDLWMIKTDFQGNTLNRKQYTSVFSSCDVDNTVKHGNHLYINGRGWVDNATGIVLAKLDFNGDTIFTRRRRHPDANDFAMGIIVGHDNKLVLNVLRHWLNQRKRECILMRFDTLGNYIDEKVMFTQNNPSNIESMVYKDGLYYFSYRYSFRREPMVCCLSDFDGCVVKTDTNFNIVFRREFGGQGDFADFWEERNYFPLDNKESVFIWVQDSFNHTWVDREQTNTALHCVDSVGNKKWTFYFATSVDQYRERAVSMAKRVKNGDIVIVGQVVGSRGMNRGWVCRFSAKGQLKWERLIRDSLYSSITYEHTYLIDFEETESQDLVITGRINSNHPRIVFDALLIKLDSNGCQLDNCFINVSTKEPLESIGFSIAPNPSDNDVSIKLDNSLFYDDLNIVVTDITGQIVLKQQIQTTHTPLSIDVSKLSVGVYQCTLYAKGRSPTSQKLIIAR